MNQKQVAYAAIAVVFLAAIAIVLVPQAGQLFDEDAEGTYYAAIDFAGAVSEVNRCVGDNTRELIGCAALPGMELASTICYAADSDGLLTASLDDERYAGADWGALRPACDRWDIAMQSPRFLAGVEFEKARQEAIALTR